MNLITAVFIDDEALICRQMSDIFNWIDPDVKLLGTFSTVESAIRFLENQKVDVIFTDIFLKSGSGIDIAKYVYKHKLSTKVILVSAHESFCHAKEGYKYAVYAYINKPFDIAELKEILAQLKKLPLLSTDASSDTGASTKQKTVCQDTQPLGKQYVVFALEYMESHYNKDISMSEVASRLNLNPSYFSRLFKQSVGVNFSIYLISLRMNKAMAMLKDSPTPIDVIARSVGYHHIPLFYNAFKKHTGLTPSEYRKTYGKED